MGENYSVWILGLHIKKIFDQERNLAIKYLILEFCFTEREKHQVNLSDKIEYLGVEKIAESADSDKNGKS